MSMKPIQFTFPDFKERALTFSYDDGVKQDRRLVEIFNRFNLKATFHLNSGAFGTDTCVSKEEVAELYKGHEVASHTLNHPFPSQQPNEANMSQLLEDRRSLEALVKRPVRGFSYPFGDFGGGYPSLLSAAGIDYARTVHSTHEFMPPDDFLRWNPTCHHNDMLLDDWEKFLTSAPWRKIMRLMYVWGHSYEFDNNNNWDMFESFCELASKAEGVWFATNGEIMDYLLAVRRLKFSVEGGYVDNPSRVTVFAVANGQKTEIKPGWNKI